MAQAEDARWRELMRTSPGPRLAIVLGQVQQVDGYGTKYWLRVDYGLRGDDLREQIFKVRREGWDGGGQGPQWLTPQELAERMVAYLWSLKELLGALQSVQYQVGDVVNGHRFNGQEWIPLDD